jgi:uroporphyrinogen-III synthase
MSTEVFPPDVILLRSPDDPDPYVRTFEELGLRAVCRPVLDFSFPADEALRTRLEQRDRYKGVIASSPRAGRAVRRVFDEAGTLHAQWENAPAFVVGPTTADRFRALGFDVRGEEAGDAEALVAHIVDSDWAGRLLFLSGAKRRDTIPDGLRVAGLPFDEEVVYDTHLREDLSFPESDGDTWLAFFSPTGLEAIQQAEAGPLDDYRCAAIGDTTAGALRDAGVDVEAVADTPSPDGLLAAIRRAATPAE